MVITGIIILGITVYAVWAVRKVRRDRKNRNYDSVCTKSGYKK